MGQLRHFSAFAWVACTVMLGCGPNSSRPLSADETPSISGKVIDSGGRPVGDASIVAFSQDGAVQHTVLADSNGQFSVRAPSGQVSLSATSGLGWAVVPAAKDGAVLTLSSECSVLRGRSTASPKDASVAVVAFHFGESAIPSPFLLHRGIGGDFSKCLPDGEYVIDADRSVSATKLQTIHLPASRSLDVVSYSNEIVWTGPGEVSASAALEELDFYERLPASTRILGIAESNHGTSDFLTSRIDTILAMASEREVIVLFEAGICEMMVLDDYIQGTEVDLSIAVQGLGFWIWDTQEFHNSIRRLRAWNAAAPPSRRIRLGGFDVQYSAAALARLLRDGHLVGAESDSLDAIAAIGPNLSNWRALADTEQDRARTELNNINPTEKAHPYSEVGRAALSALSLRGTLAIVESYDAEGQHGYATARDTWMAQAVRFYENGAPENSLIVLVGHAGHLGKSAKEGYTTLGMHLSSSHGAGYSAVVQIALDGVVRAWDSDQAIGVVPHVLSVPVEATVDAFLGKATTPLRPYVWFRDLDENSQTWLLAPHYMREFGSVFPGERDSWVIRDVAGAFDGAVVFRNVAPSSPTPTGIRKAE